MHFLSEDDIPWISLKNDLLLVLDIVVGLGLVYLALAHGGPGRPYALASVRPRLLTTDPWRRNDSARDQHRLLRAQSAVLDRRL